MNFSEIAKNRQSCRFFDNTKQVEEEKISRERYDNYLMFVDEIEKNRRYKVW